MENFEELFEESLAKMQVGDVVIGSVSQVSLPDVFVAFGYKSDGVIDISELNPNIQLGDEVKAVITNFNPTGYVTLARKPLLDIKNLDLMEEAFENQTPVEVIIRKQVMNGFSCDFKTLKGFIHDTQTGVQNGKDIIDETLTVLVGSFDKKRKSFACSARAYKQQRKEIEIDKFLQEHQIGEVLEGTVNTIKDYGAFIAIGYIHGFLHKSNISWGRVNKVDDFLKVDETIQVKIIGMNEEKKTIEVGLKQTLQNPMESAFEKYKTGDRVNVQVVFAMRDGYICEVEKGVDGFLAKNEINWVRSSKKTIKVGDEVEVMILEADKERGRFNLSVKRTLENPWDKLVEELKKDDIVKGTITHIESFGLFVDVYNGINGVVHIRDISWTKNIEDLKELYKVGDTIDVVVLNIMKERERMALGIKQLEANPWNNIDMSVNRKTPIKVTISEISKDGVKVNIQKDIDGFIPNNEIDLNTNKDDLKVGETLDAIVLNYSIKELSVNLSVKKHTASVERVETKSYMKQMKQVEKESAFGSVFAELLEDKEDK